MASGSSLLLVTQMFKSMLPWKTELVVYLVFFQHLLYWKAELNDDINWFHPSFITWDLEPLKFIHKGGMTWQDVGFSVLFYIVLVFASIIPWMSNFSGHVNHLESLLTPVLIPHSQEFWFRVSQVTCMEVNGRQAPRYWHCWPECQLLTNHFAN